MPNKLLHSKTRILIKAKHIHKTLGIRVAAKYLSNQGISIECARYVLLGI